MQQSIDIEAINQQIYIESAFVEKLNEQTSKVIVGQHHMIERLLLGLLAKGHVLLEGLPGLAKTLAIKHLPRQSMQTLAEFSLRPTFCLRILLVQ